MKVEVRPLDIPRWHGKRGREAFQQPQTIRALYDPTVGGYATGLTEEEEKKYQKELGVDLTNTYNQNEPHPFWDSKMAAIKLENHTQIFETKRALDFVKVKVMKASKYVANSLKEWEDGLYPEATHVIYDEEQSLAIRATKAQKRAKAYKIAAKLNKEDQINILQVLSEKSVKGRSQNFLDVEIDQVIEDRIDDFLEITKMDKKRLYLKSTILESINRNVLTKEGNSIFYMGDQLGFDLESTIKYFEDPQNQNIKVAILEKLNK